MFVGASTLHLLSIDPTDGAVEAGGCLSPDAARLSGSESPRCLLCAFAKLSKPATSFDVNRTNVCSATCVSLSGFPCLVLILAVTARGLMFRESSKLWRTNLTPSWIFDSTIMPSFTSIETYFLTLYLACEMIIILILTRFLCDYLKLFVSFDIIFS